jgi:hypothetical protein
MSLPGAKINLKRRPVYATGIATASDGSELRASWQTYPRYRYTLSIEFLRSAAAYAEFQRVMSAFEQMAGAYDSFLIVDPEDCQVTNHGFGVTDGSSIAYQLQRTLGGVRQVGTWDPQTYPVSTVPRANYAIQSQFASSWGLGLATLTPNAAVAPDGTLTAALLKPTATDGTHYTSEVSPSIPTAPGPFTHSVWLKQANFTWAVVRMYEELANHYVLAFFDLANGVVGTVQASGANFTAPVARIVPYLNGWFRCSISGSKNSTAGIQTMVMVAFSDGNNSFDADGSSGIYVWGDQIETGAAPTQYIPTTTAAVTATPAYWPQQGDGFVPVTDVNPASLTIFLNGAGRVPGVEWNYSGGGVITWTTTPAAGEPLAWSGSYFRRVRFANDDLELERILQALWQGETIELISTK